MKLKLNDIIIRDRRRKEFNEKKMEKLVLSLRTTGLIQPVVVDDKNRLVAGERRIRAARLNGWTEIEIVRKDDLDDLDREIMEFEENVQREDYTPGEVILAENRLHELYTEKFGKPGGPKKWREEGAGKRGWRQEDTAELLGISEGQMSEQLRLARAVRSEPELGKLKTRDAIVRTVRQKHEEGLRRVMVALGDTANGKEPHVGGFVQGGVEIYHADSRELLKKLGSESHDLVLTDPLWDVEFDKEIVSENIDAHVVTLHVMRECYRIMKEGSHGFMFFGMVNYVGYLWLLKDVGFTVEHIPLVWYKPGGGYARDPSIQIKNDYETCFHFFKGQRPKFLKPLSAVHMHNVIRGEHKAAKPVEMLCKLIDATTVEGERVLDPFCGGGSTIEACIRMGRKCTAVDVDENCHNMSVLRARKLLKS